jgi:hypothetical protein
MKRNLRKPEKKLNIAVVTLETRDSEMLSIHNSNVKKYCDLHEYTYIFKNSYENVLNLPIYWKKIQLVKEILEDSDFDYVLWMDSDTIIVDNSIKLENILYHDNKLYSIYMGDDFNSDFNLNAGVFAIKNDYIGISFLNECINIYVNRNTCKDENGNYALNGEWSKGCYEQGVMNELIKTIYINHFKFLENHIVLNTFIPSSACFILHLYGGIDINKDKRRVKAFKNIINNNTCLDTRISQLLFLVKHFGMSSFYYIM